MYQRFFAVALIAGSLSGLIRWTDPSRSVSPSNAERSIAALSQPYALSMKQDLIETLDQLVIAENQFRDTHHHYTRILSNLKINIPAIISEHYEITVQEATSDRLVITAFSEKNGATEDQVSITQNFQINANFPLPTPRPEYLRNMALQHLELFRDAGATPNKKQSFFQGYFQFNIRRDNLNNPVVVANGIRPPVSGMILEAPLEPPETQQTNTLLTEVIRKFPRIRGYKTGELNRDLEIEPIALEGK